MHASRSAVVTTFAGTFSAATLRLPVLALSISGVDPTPLLDELGVTDELVADRTARVAAELVFAAFERAVELARDEQLFLRLGRAVPAGALGPFEDALRGSTTIGQTLARVCRYWRFIDDVGALRLEVEGDFACIAGRRRARPSPRQATDALFAVVLARGTQLSGGREWPLRSVCFAAGPPRDVAAYERFFGAPVSFGHGRNELSFHASFLDVPCRDDGDVPAADAVHEALTGLSEAAPTLLGRARAAVADGVRSGDVSLARTARGLGVSARTLQRHLALQRTSHRGIVDDVRRELAHAMLLRTDAPVSAIAFDLGFCDASAFHRAFSRWTGTTPLLYRERASRAVRGDSRASPPTPCSASPARTS